MRPGPHLDKGKPVVRRGRKATGLYPVELAGLPKERTFFMFSRVRASWSVLFIVVTVALSALPAAAQTASSTGTIAVPSIQKVEGTTSLVVVAGGPPPPRRPGGKSKTTPGVGGAPARPHRGGLLGGRGSPARPARGAGAPPRPGA